VNIIDGINNIVCFIYYNNVVF